MRVDVVLDLVGLAGHLAGADLVVTGEGQLDARTLHRQGAGRGRPPGTGGRRPGGGRRRRCLLDDEDLRRAGFDAAHALTDLADPDRCVREAGPLLRRLAARVARDSLLTPREARP